IPGDRAPRAEIAPRVALGVDRDGQLRDVGVVTEELDLLARPVGDDLRLTGHAGEHPVGQLANDALRRRAEGQRLARAVLDQDVAELPAWKTTQALQENGPRRRRAERAGLRDRIHLVVDTDQIL